MLSEYKFNRIRILRDEGKNLSQISEELSLDRKTVRKYLNSNSPPSYKQRSRRTKQDPFAPFEAMAKRLLKGCEDLSATELFEKLHDEGYRGSERTVDRRVAILKGERPKERFFEQEYEPGEQAQFDFKEKVEIPFTDGSRVTYLHFGTLPHSDIRFIHAYPFKTFECFADGIHCFFEKVGGLTQNIRIDNLSPAVRKVLEGDKRLYTKGFERVIKYYGFKVLPCAPGKGSEKGDVERDIRTYTKRILNRIKLEGLMFKGWSHLNQWLDEFIRGLLSQESKEKFSLEKNHLKPLPPRDEEVLCRIEEGTTSLFGTVRINKSTYSVPDTAIGVRCRTVMGPYEVSIYRMDGVYSFVAKHPIKPEKEHSILLEHILSSLHRKPKAMIRWTHKDLLFPHPVCRKFYSRLKEVDSNSAERDFLRTINLILHLPLSEVISAMELVLESNSQQLFEDAKTLLLGERRPAEVIDISHRLGQLALQPELSQYDKLIPAQGDPSDGNIPRTNDSRPQAIEAELHLDPIRRASEAG